MKRFKEYLNEMIAWEDKTKNYVYSNYPFIPLSSKMIDRLFGGIKKKKVFHVTSEDHIDDIVKLQGKKKSISAFTQMIYPVFEDGIQGGGGILFELEADLIVGRNRDIMSRPDSQGRRWLGVEQAMVLNPRTTDKKIQDDINLLKQLLPKEKAKLFLDVYKDNDEIMKKLEKSIETYGDYHYADIGYIYNKSSGKEKANMIKGWYDITEKLIGKYKDAVKFLLLNDDTMNNSNDDGWNEMVVNNIKIKNMYWKEAPYDTMKPYHKKITGKEFDQKVNVISNQQHWDKITK